MFDKWQFLFVYLLEVSTAPSTKVLLIDVVESCKRNESRLRDSISLFSATQIFNLPFEFNW